MPKSAIIYNNLTILWCSVVGLSLYGVIGETALACCRGCVCEDGLKEKCAVHHVACRIAVICDIWHCSQMLLLLEHWPDGGPLEKCLILPMAGPTLTTGAKEKLKRGVTSTLFMGQMDGTFIPLLHGCSKYCLATPYFIPSSQQQTYVLYRINITFSTRTGTR